MHTKVIDMSREVDHDLQALLIFLAGLTQIWYYSQNIQDSPSITEEAAEIERKHGAQELLILHLKN